MPPHLYRAPAASEELRNFVDIPLAALVKSTARAAAVNFAFRFVRYPLSLFSVAALARLLTPSDFGVYEVVGAFASLWAAFGDLGITGAVIHKEVLEEDDLSGLFWVNIAAGLILLTLLSASGPVIAKLYKDPRQAGLAVLAGLAFLMISAQAPFAAICERSAAARRALYRLGEEVTELEHALRCMHVLARHSAADSGRMDAHFLGDLFDHHRL